MSLDEVFAYFEKYDTATFGVYACQGNEPSEADVEAFERTIGFPLPADFHEFTTSPLGGLYMEVREEVWPRPEQYSVGPFWTFLFGIAVFGIGQGIPEWLDIRVQYEEFKELSDGELVPFLKVMGDADQYCFTRSGAIVQWHHETGETEPVEITFPQLLMREIRALEERKDQMVNQRERRKR